MTVSSTPDLAQYVATAGQTIFVYAFGILEDGDLDVYLTPDGVPFDAGTQQLTLNTNYTVQGAGDEAGGTITLIIAATLNDIITIDGDLIVQRTTDFGQAFLASQINSSLDRLTMYARSNKTSYDTRSLHYGVGDVIGTGENIFPKLAAGQFVKKADSGDALIAASLPEDPDSSTLRTDLSSQTNGGDGSRLVGYNDTPLTGPTTVHDQLAFLTRIVTEETYVVGDVKITTRSTPAPSWLIAAGPGLAAPRTIGNAASGANVRANADTINLFNILWDTYNNTNAPVSTGRGASAIDDFNANKTIQFPDYAGRGVGIGGLGAGLTGRGQDDFIGAEGHTITKAEVPPHVHTYSIDTVNVGDAQSGATFGIFTPSTTNTGDGSADGLAGDAFNMMNPMFYMFLHIKL